MTKKSIVDELTQIHTELNNSGTRNAFETLNTTPVISSEVAVTPTVVHESSPELVKPTTDRIPYELLALTRNEITILEFLIEQGDMVITVKRMAGLVGGRFGTIKIRRGESDHERLRSQKTGSHGKPSGNVFHHRAGFSGVVPEICGSDKATFEVGAAIRTIG